MPAVDSDGFAWYALPDGEPNWRYLTASEIAERELALALRLLRPGSQQGPRPHLVMDRWHSGLFEPAVK